MKIILLVLMYTISLTSCWTTSEEEYKKELTKGVINNSISKNDIVKDLEDEEIESKIKNILDELQQNLKN